MKKLFAFLLAMIMVLSMATVAFADTDEEEPTYPGKITVQNLYTSSQEGFTVTYEAYRILDLTSYSTAGDGAYSYVINPAWAGFFAEGSDAWKYVQKNDLDYIVGLNTFTQDNAPQFAALAIAYAKENDIAPVKSSKNAGEFVITGTDGVFSNLPLGYYLVDSDVGALCGLTTTNPNAKIVAKNGIPTIDKQVEEDSTTQFGEQNTADFDQPMNFKTTINVHPGAQNYVLHDTMENMEFLGVTGVTLNGVDQSDYTVLTPPEDPEDDPEEEWDGCTFEVVFGNTLMGQLTSNDKLVVTYQAKLTTDAVISGKGNTNQTYLKFGENHTTTTDKTQTYTYAFDLAKTDSQNLLLDGASFRIFDENGAAVPVVPVIDEEGKQVLENNKPLYRRAKAGEEGQDIVVTGGLVRVIGFDNGKYFLEEIKAPDGYNELKARQQFIIADGNLDAVLTTKDNGKVEVTTGSCAHVVNKAGSMLPETGAMGTTMFITFGMFVVLATGVLLVTKKRMTMIED